jgi:hypothetical protein
MLLVLLFLNLNNEKKKNISIEKMKNHKIMVLIQKKLKYKDIKVYEK